MKKWVRFSVKPNVRSVIASLNSLAKQLETVDKNTAVTGIRLNGKERVLEIEIDAKE